MAIIVSPVWSSIRGSIAGTTYLTTPAGAIIGRQRVQPTQAPTPFRTFAKNALSQAASDWDGLTVDQKKDWNVWAAANSTLTGRQEFTAGRSLRNFVFLSGIAGVQVITTDLLAPTFNGHPVVTVQATVYTTALGTGVAFKTTNTGPEKVIVMLELSAGLSNGRYYWKGPWDASKSIAFLQLAANSATTNFDGLVESRRYYVRCRAFTMDTLSGLTGCVVSAASITFSDAVTNP